MCGSGAFNSLEHHMCVYSQLRHALDWGSYEEKTSCKVYLAASAHQAHVTAQLSFIGQAKLESLSDALTLKPTSYGVAGRLVRPQSRSKRPRIGQTKWSWLYSDGACAVMWTCAGDDAGYCDTTL